MSFVRVNVPLLPAESGALRELAEEERRRPEAQAAWLIRQELERRGLLPQEPQQAQQAGEGQHASNR